MARKFTRIEFEGGSVVVVKSPESGDGHIIEGNHESGWNRIVGFPDIPHMDVVDKVIGAIGKKAKRRLSHSHMMSAGSYM